VKTEEDRTQLKVLTYIRRFFFQIHALV